MVQHLSAFEFGDIAVRYPFDPASGRVGLELLPSSMAGEARPRREGLAGLPYIDAIPDAGNPPAYVIDSLLQVKILGDPYSGGFAQGHTMRNSPSVDSFAYHEQRAESMDEGRVIITVLKNSAGCELEHCLSWRHGDAALEIQTTFRNLSAERVTLEMLGSFSIGGITPFVTGDAPNRLKVHRFRSAWSAEGRLETRSIEQLHLERSWSGAGMFSERFGQIGSMPVRKWFPFIAVEDVEAGVIWGAQLAWAGSWQMEIFRQHDDVCLSGGLADREFGHWMKTVAPGESLFVTCVKGDLDQLCDRLTHMQQRACDTHPGVEQDLPIVFNEWCTTWGDPEHDKVLAIADRLKGSPVKYLVIDAGWYKAGNAGWSDGHGDWNPSPALFPKGLKATASAIRERGLIPGLWFEMETCGESSAAFSLANHLLKRDGMPVTVRSRRFWDLNDTAAVDYLTTKVIDLLESGGFGYLKVDYNETIGIGADHPDSLGEGLRCQVNGIYRFFDRIRERLPDLVIENCSSGGHRLEPSMLALTAMSSFSDAHELVEIPIIAANLHRLILPRQNQIWAVLHRSDNEQRLIYSLAATFLGRMCLSGEITELSQSQWELVANAQRLYLEVAPIIKHGVSRRYSELGESWRYPEGWQAVLRTSADKNKALLVLHAFERAPDVVKVPLPHGEWHVESQLAMAGSCQIHGRALEWKIGSDFSAAIIVLEKAR